MIGPYSSRGPTWGDGYAKPDLVAPGHKLLAPVDDDSELPKRNPIAEVRSHRTGRRT